MSKWQPTVFIGEQATALFIYAKLITNNYLLCMLLISSDPVISSLLKLPQRKSGSFSTEVLALLAIPTPSTAAREESPIPTSDHGSDSD
jgi:hypothetical protein